MDPELVIKPLKCLAEKLGFIIMDNSSGHTKVIEHVMLDELDHI